MARVTSGLADPPSELRGFPAAVTVSQLHRLSEWPHPWWYSTVTKTDSSTGGRFDLAAPRGTCYLAESLEGALVEKLLRWPVRVVVAERLDELMHATVGVRTAPAIADLTSPVATGFGLNAEIHSGLDYLVPRRWAYALWRDGWRGLRYLLRGDVSGKQAGRGLFGSAGTHVRAPAGMSTVIRPLDLTLAEQVLAERGVEVRPIPDRVPIQPPPGRQADGHGADGR